MKLIQGDCLPAMKEMPDNAFDLAIVDPEFGIGIGKSARLVTDKGLSAKHWDDKPVGLEYFTELFRVSINQIIWGGNYYPLPANKHCVIWDKMQPESLSFGMFDYAWTSFDGANKMFRQSVKKELNRIHPTQKPVALYKWLLTKYAKPGQTILDTHGGSMSIAIACYDLGYDLTVYEIDKEYFQAATERIERHKAQGQLFQAGEVMTVENMEKGRAMP